MFAQLPKLPADPILGLSAAFRADPNPDKIDLGVGVYKTETGDTPVLECVKRAEARRLEDQTTKAYTPPSGVAGANRAAAEIAFGPDHPALREQRVATIQTPGGCGALRAGAELIQRARPGARVWVSSPTWANHVPLLSEAGLTLEEYPYYDGARHGIDFDAMMQCLEQAGPEDLVLLHACCHNPSGADLTRQQWQAVADLAERRGFSPYIDMAYQGFGESLTADAYGVRLLAERVPEMLVASSFSKNFGLYRERAGSLSIMGADAERAEAIHSQLLSVARGLYSMPPAHGATLIDIIYHDASLSELWEQELAGMRDRINGLRRDLAAGLNRRQSRRDFDFIQREQGMFSFLGLNVDQVTELRERYSIYMTDNSRINVAGINADNIDRLCDAIVAVL